MAAGEVLKIDSGGAVTSICRVPQRPSGLGFLPTGDLLLVSMLDRKLMRYDGKALCAYADLSGIVTAPLNDMVVTPEGTAYVTNFGYESRPRQPTSIVKVGLDQEPQMQTGELWRPNGCVVTASGSTLIVSECRVNRLTAFAVDSDGTLKDPRLFAGLGSSGWADGICIDEDDAVWVADPINGRCLRVQEGGEILDVVETGQRGAIACALGGDDGRRLFVTTSELGEMEELLPKRQAQVLWFDVEVAKASRA